MVTSLFNLGVNLVVVLLFILAFWAHAAVDLAALPTDRPRPSSSSRPPSRCGVASLYVRFRDTAIIWTVVATALFYATPILYPMEFVPERYRD